MLTKSVDERITPILEELIRAELPLATFIRAIRRKYISVAVRIHQKKSTAALILGVDRNTVSNHTPSSRRRTREDR